jgi:hypothetical protein
MANVSLADFIDENRDELIGRCRAKVAKRTAPPPTDAEIGHGVPLFLSQLRKELRGGLSKTHEIGDGALQHGRDLLARGFTIGQVVHDYGDVCQSITDLAFETRAPISTDEFRTLNRCLDDAIAGAVTEFAAEQEVGREGEWSELWSLVNSVSVAFDALESGKVGVTGSTATLIHRNIVALRAFVDRREVNLSKAAGLPAVGAAERRHEP